MAYSAQIFDDATLNPPLRRACLGMMVAFASQNGTLPSNYILYPSDAPAQEIAINRSTINYPVSAGGFADVYKAVLLHDQKHLVVAVKRPRKRLLQKMKFVSLSLLRFNMYLVALKYLTWSTVCL